MTRLKIKVLAGALLVTAALPLGGCIVFPSDSGPDYYAGSGPAYYNYNPPPYYQERPEAYPRNR